MLKTQTCIFNLNKKCPRVLHEMFLIENVWVQFIVQFPSPNILTQDPLERCDS